MRTKKEVQDLLNSPCKVIEETIGVKFRNGQGTQSAKQTLKWILSEGCRHEILQ